MTTLRTLAVSLRAAARAVEVNAVETVKAVAQNVGLTVVYATPIDTSRARMNWQGSIGSPAAAELSPYPNKPSDPSIGSSVAIQSIRRIVSRYTGQQGGIFITNNTMYIQLLNNGSSSQAPANFVAKAVMAGLQATRNVRILP